MDRQMKMVQNMQKQMQKIQEELGNATVTGSAGGGAVIVTMSGHQEIKAIKIAKEAVDPEDVETLEEMVITACKDAMEKARQLSESRMAPIAGGLKGMGLGF